MLLKKVNQVKPKMHVFGHIHEGYGMIGKENIIFANASTLNVKYQMTNPPIILEL